jgi:ankyrin repeat protein
LSGGPANSVAHRCSSLFIAVHRCSSLFIAAGQGNVDMVRLLLDADADLHAVNSADMTALHSAARDGQLETATLLVARGAPSTERILNDVLHVAQMTAHSHPGVVSLLQATRLKMASAGGQGDGLHKNAEAGNIAGIEAALAGEVDVNGRDGRGMEPLSWAALRGHDAVAVLLIQHGADVNRPNRSAWPPIGQACGQGHSGMVRVLLEHGADVNLTWGGGRTALMCAAHRGFRSIGGRSSPTPPADRTEP